MNEPAKPGEPSYAQHRHFKQTGERCAPRDLELMDSILHLVIEGSGAAEELADPGAADYHRGVSMIARHRQQIAREVVSERLAELAAEARADANDAIGAMTKAEQAGAASVISIIDRARVKASIEALLATPSGERPPCNITPLVADHFQRFGTFDLKPSQRMAIERHVHTLCPGARVIDMALDADDHSQLLIRVEPRLPDPEPEEMPI